MTSYPLLDTISTPAQLRELDRKQLPQLADELRDFLVESVAKTGGHLSSNLGTVELTIALHYVFDTPNDKLVWDVGHQTYAHKVLSGPPRGNGQAAHARRRLGLSQARRERVRYFRRRPLVDVDLGRVGHGAGFQAPRRNAAHGGDHRRRRDVGRSSLRGDEQCRRRRRQHARRAQRQRHVDLGAGRRAQQIPGAAVFGRHLQRRAQGRREGARRLAVAARIRQPRRRARQGNADAGERCSRNWASTTSGRSTATTSIRWCRRCRTCRSSRGRSSCTSSRARDTATSSPKPTLSSTTGCRSSLPRSASKAANPAANRLTRRSLATGCATWRRPTPGWWRSPRRWAKARE